MPSLLNVQSCVSTYSAYNGVFSLAGQMVKDRQTQFSVNTVDNCWDDERMVGTGTCFGVQMEW